MNIQIANYHISDKSKIIGSGKAALIPQRKDAAHSGVFTATVDVSFDPAVNDYPIGTVKIQVDLSDSFKGSAHSTTIEQVNTHGRHTPTAIITGRCKVSLNEHATTPKGCRFWILIANNKKAQEHGTPDIMSFIVYDRNGMRIAYGSGPATEGNIEVTAGAL
jgi:hypothetical protein